MREIKVRNIRLKNFRSFIEDEITFPSTTGLKLLNGENQLEPRLGANGSGKSSLWDSFCWVLYGKGIRGTRISSLQSWGATVTEVVLDLEIDNVAHVVKRTGPPMRLEVDGQPTEQPFLDNLVGLSYDRFLHSIVFGQGVALFPDLSGPSRSELFDEVLNLSLWANAVELTVKKHTDLQVKRNEINTSISFIDGKLAQIPTNESIQLQINSWAIELETNLASLHLEYNKWNNERDANLNSLHTSSDTWEKTQERELEHKALMLEEFENKINAAVGELAQVEKTLGEENIGYWEEEARKVHIQLDGYIRDTYRLDSERKTTITNLDFFSKNQICPTCNQDITVESKMKQIKGLNELEQRNAEATKRVIHAMDLAKDNAASLTKLLNEKKANINELSNQKLKLKSDLNWLSNQAAWVEKDAEQLIKDKSNPYQEQITRAELARNPILPEIERLEASVNPYIKLFDDTVSERTILQQERELEQGYLKDTLGLLTAAEYWKHGFKRIRLYFVQQILQALEIEIGSALSALGLNGWSIKLATETETKSGTTKLGINIAVKSPKAEGPWEGWSGGETQRLRLAIAIGLSSLIQRAAGVRFTMEVFDEPSAWLSAEGIEDLLEALRYRAEAQNKQVWVTDHRALTYSGFKEIWCVAKGAEGSKMLLTSKSEI